MPRTRRNIRRRGQLSSHGPAIANLYSRDASESDAVAENPSSALSIDEPPPIPKQQKTRVEVDRESSEESDAGWSDDNDMSSDLGFSLSLSSSGNHDEDGTITTRTSCANKANKDTNDQHDRDDDEDGYLSLPDKSIGEGSSQGQQSEGSSSSGGDGTSSRSRSSSGMSSRSGSGMSNRSGSGMSSRSGSGMSSRSGSGDESSRRRSSGDESSRSHSSEKGSSFGGSDHGDDGPIQHEQRDSFFPEEFADEYFPAEATKPVGNHPKGKMISTIDDFMDKDQDRRAIRRYSLNDRAVFRLIDATDNIDCAATDPGWGNIHQDPKTDRRHTYCLGNFNYSFDEGEFAMLGCQDDNSDDDPKSESPELRVPHIVSTESAGNDDKDYEYGADDLQDHTRNYDARYDRDLSELATGRPDRSYRVTDDNEGDDSEDDDPDDNTYLNRSVASYISGDNSSRSQHDPFLRPDVSDRPPTPPSPLKRSPPRNQSQCDDEDDKQQESYHSLPMSPNLQYDRDDAPGSGHSAEDGNASEVETFSSNFHDDYEQDYQHNGNGIVKGGSYADSILSLPQIDENTPVHHDHRRSGSTFDPQPTTEIPYGDIQHSNKLAKERRRDRKLIRWLAVGLGCALLALSAVLGAVIATALFQTDTPPVAVSKTNSTFSPAASPLSLPPPSPNVPISVQPTRQPTIQQITSAPQSASPTRSPTISPITGTPSKAPVRTTVAPTPLVFGVARVP